MPAAHSHPDISAGQRCGTGDLRAGAYQYPALGVGGAVIDLSGITEEYVTIRWFPGDPLVDGVLWYGFFVDQATATVGFDAATSSGSPGAVVPTAPDWVERGSVDVTIPKGFPWLRIEASAGAGRALVRSSDGG